MPAIILDQGRYDLVETIHRHGILVLNGQRRFAWIESREGDHLAITEPDYQVDGTLAHGQFYLVEFRGDSRFDDRPRLFLQEAERWWEFVLSEGLPTDRNPERPIARSDEVLTSEFLEEHLGKHGAA